MGELVLHGQAPPVADETLFSRAASFYCDLLDASPGNQVRLDQVWDRLLAEYPDEYNDLNRHYCMDKLRSPEFGDVMAEKRKVRLMCTLAARITAGEIGFALAGKAYEELFGRLEANPAKIATRDLIAILKAGFELSEKATQGDKEGEGEVDASVPKVVINATNVLMGLPPERRAVVANELGRQFLADANQGESKP